MKIISRFFCLVLIIFSLSACASAPKTSTLDKTVNEDGSVTLGFSGNSSRSTFSQIDPSILSLVREGSPQSLKQAAVLLHKSVEEDYTEDEKILLYCITKLMQIVWPSENILWNYSELQKANPYSGAIETAQKGIFDRSTGNIDYLTVLLPSLVSVLYPGTNLDLSVQAVLKSLEFESSSTLSHYLLGKFYLDLKDGSKALEYFNQAALKAGDSLEIKVALIKANYQLKNYNYSLRQGEFLLDSYPQNIEVLEICSNSAFALNNLEKAEEYIVRVLLVEPENLSFLLMRSRILMAKGDYVRASSLLEVYEKTNNINRDFLLLKTELQREWNKNNTLALETISKAYSLYPDDIAVLEVASELAETSGSTVNGLSSIKLADKIFSLDPDNKIALRVYITKMIRDRNFESAYSFSSRLVNIDSSDENVINHVEVCLSLKKYEEAQKYATEIYEKNPKDDSARQIYVRMFAGSGQSQKALALITQFLQDSRQNMKSFLYYQRSFLQGTQDEALSDLRLSLTANPRNKDSLYRLYEIYYSKKDYRRAQYYLKQVVALDASNGFLLQKNAELDSLLKK